MLATMQFFIASRDIKYVAWVCNKHDKVSPNTHDTELAFCEYLYISCPLTDSLSD